MHVALHRVQPSIVWTIRSHQYPLLALLLTTLPLSSSVPSSQSSGSPSWTLGSTSTSSRRRDTQLECVRHASSLTQSLQYCMAHEGPAPGVLSLVSDEESSQRSGDTLDESPACSDAYESMKLAPNLQTDAIRSTYILSIKPWSALLLSTEGAGERLCFSLWSISSQISSPCITGV